MAADGNAEFKLVGHKNFVRHNPRSDRFEVHRFHHVEFWCSDATNCYKRFQHALGMTLVAKSDQSTGNSAYASYVLQSHELVFAFTAPYSKTVAHNSTPGSAPLPSFSHDTAFDFIIKHGLAVRALGLVVGDAAEAFKAATAHGAVPVQEPITLGKGPQQQVVSEVKLYGDVVLRFVSGDVKNPFLAGYEKVTDAPHISYGLRRLDHAVGNVPVLADAAKYIMGFTGFHEFAEFVAEDVGTLDSGLNSVVLANNNEYVLLPVNEPTFGTPRKSQIQTYLEQNEGAGLQHMALKTNDIFHTLREMQSRSHCGGLEFMPRPSHKYYKELPQKVGDALSAAQLAECEALGVLVDKDDQGVLLQIFTKPLGDRPTVFVEIIQRVGCMRGGSGSSNPSPPASAATAPAHQNGNSTPHTHASPHSHPIPDAASHPLQTDPSPSVPPLSSSSTTTTNATTTTTPPAVTQLVQHAVQAAVAAAADVKHDGGSDAKLSLNSNGVHGPADEPQAAGCGGFGKGNFSELFKRIEDYERTLTV